MRRIWRRGKFTLFAVVTEIVFIVLFAIFVEYDKNIDAKYDHSAYTKNYTESEEYKEKYGDKAHDEGYGYKTEDYYPLFQDVHVMIFVGFGFLMTFMRRYSYSGVGFNMLVGAYCIQWSTLMAGFLHLHHDKIVITIQTLLLSDFACAAVLVTFGAVLGRLSPIQMLVMTLCEIAIFQANEYVGLSEYYAVDIGGSMFVHVFGAYFGIALGAMIYHRDEVEHVQRKEHPIYHSDIFSLIGTIFLWMFWPSFNSALASGDERTRAIINTYYALAASCVCTFAISVLVNKEDKLEMEHIQNATLAGGVAIGTIADMNLDPWVPLVVGAVAGSWGTIGFRYITPFLAKKLKLHDICGVNNLHGMPGLISGIAGIIVAAVASEKDWGPSVYELYPARVPKDGTEAYEEFKLKYDLPPGEGRDAGEQAIWQLIALATTLGVALVGGIVVGLILRIPVWSRPHEDDLFEDSMWWEIGDEYPSVLPAKDRAVYDTYDHDVMVVSNDHYPNDVVTKI